MRIKIHINYVYINIVFSRQMQNLYIYILTVFKFFQIFKALFVNGKQNCFTSLKVIDHVTFKIMCENASI